MTDQDDKDEIIAFDELLKSIKSMAQSQAQLVEIAQSLLKEIRRKPRDTR